MNLTDPEDHKDPYQWAAVYVAHFGIGAVLWLPVHSVLPHAELSYLFILLCYLVVWECGIQRLRAGLIDALVDSLAVGGGALFSASLWRHDIWTAYATIGILAPIAIFGIRRRL